MDDTVLFRAESELVITEARRRKAKRTKSLGSPIQLAGKAIDIIVEGNTAWIAENTHVAKKIDLESGSVLQIYRGHTAPVTCLAFYQDARDTCDQKMLITGSWDKTIKIWNTNSKALLCSTTAHDDFVKSLLVVPSAKLLVSSSSDKSVRLWDLTDVVARGAITPVGSVSMHTRPVECLAGHVLSETQVTLFTGDTMGVINVWKLEKELGSAPRWRSIHLNTLNLHRTRVTDMVYDGTQLWTASSDETVQITPYPSDPSVTKPIPPLTHPHPVRALLPLSSTPIEEPYLVTVYGDVIRLYDVSTVSEPEILGEIDAHWYDVMSVRLWLRISEKEGGRAAIHPFIVSTSLDGTIRKWRLSELTSSAPEDPAGLSQPTVAVCPTEPGKTSDLTEQEERELAELMEEDE